MKNKEYNKAIFELRKQYQKSRLTKKQLKEAHTLYTEAEGNKARFRELMKGVMGGKG